jgi:hypothetical protein
LRNIGNRKTERQEKGLKQRSDMERRKENRRSYEKKIKEGMKGDENEE